MKRPRRKPKTTPETERVVKMMEEVDRVLVESKVILDRITAKWGHPNA